jgi:predicted unusual protein kinase regulating ubiquinone biosynthesis (AarF/ABC1/UbiB family)
MRLLAILWRLGPLGISFLRDRRRWLVVGSPLARSSEFHDRRARRLLDAITTLGPSFVKLGQLFGGRADLLPEPYAEQLATLTDQVPPVPEAAVIATIETSLGRGVNDVFERFDRQPIAAGSLGQVHRGRHLGRDVAVKVLRPGVRELVAADIRAARTILEQWHRFFPSVRTRAFRAVIDEFSIRVREEMDFRIEAANAAKIRANLATNPRLRVPAVIEAVSTDRVLVLEYMAGTRIDRLEASRRYGGLTIPDIVIRLAELYIQMMLVDGLFHADPHPGNLLVGDDGRIILLDFGVVIPVGRERRNAIVKTAFAAVNRDAAGVVDGFFELGIVEPGTEREPIVRLVVVLLDLAARRTTTRERVELLSQEILDELYRWPVNLPSDLVYFARTAALIEGIGIRYDPYYNPITAVGPALFRMRHLLLDSFDRTDWPTALGSLVGRAAGLAATAGRRFAEFLDRTLGPEPRRPDQPGPA